jgi:hypothetical protein
MVVSERRKHRRVQVKGLAAHLRALDRSFTCGVENLSEGGIFLGTDELLPRGSMVAIDLVKPSAAKALRVIGVVVVEAAGDRAPGAPQGTKGIGIQFAQMGPDVRGELLGLLAELSGKPLRKVDALRATSAAAHGGFDTPSIRAIVTPFAGPSLVRSADAADADAAADHEDLLAQLQTLRNRLAEVEGQRDDRESELRTLRLQIVAARSAGEKRERR